MNKRLVQLLNSAKIGGGTCLLDAYNQVVYTDIAPTITTRVDASSHIFVMEEVKVNQVGNLVDDSGRKFTNPQAGRVYDTEGISPCLTTMGG